MKKIIISILLMFAFTTGVDALNLNYDEYNDLGITHSFVVGDYIFDVSSGFSPSLKDFMHASRTIPEGTKSYVYEIMIVNLPAIRYKAFSMKEIYTGNNITDTNNFINLKCKYIYRNSINSATSQEYRVLD